MVAPWILVPNLVSLRNEFNSLAPLRDKASDGSIGDTAHAGSSSDHNPDESGVTPYNDSDNVNEVHAIDVDADLRKSGWSMQKAVQIVITRHRNGQDNRLQNVIWNRRIWSDSWGWVAREYTGSNPHDKHAHFSSKYTSAQEADTRPWGLLMQLRQEQIMAVLDNDDKTAITNIVRSEIRTEVKKLLTADADVAALGKARPWQYAGNPLPESKSALTVFNEMYGFTAGINAQTGLIIQAIQSSPAVNINELVEVLVPQLTTSIVAALPDMNGATPEEVGQQVTWALRGVLGSLDNV